MEFSVSVSKTLLEGRTMKDYQTDVRERYEVNDAIDEKFSV